MEGRFRLPFPAPSDAGHARKICRYSAMTARILGRKRNAGHKSRKVSLLPAIARNVLISSPPQGFRPGVFQFGGTAMTMEKETGNLQASSGGERRLATPTAVFGRLGASARYSMLSTLPTRRQGTSSPSFMSRGGMKRRAAKSSASTCSISSQRVRYHST